MSENMTKQYDGVGATTLWLPMAVHARHNPNRWNYIIDCGIDEGQYSRQYATMFNHVMSIDAIIRANSRTTLEPLSNVTMIETCLWNVAGEEMTFFDVEGDTHLSSLRKDHVDTEVDRYDINRANIKEYKMTTETLDDIIQHGVDFIKVDCEMADFEILQGAARLIEMYKPTIQVEEGKNDIAEFLQQFGYVKYENTEINFTDCLYLPKNV